MVKIGDKFREERENKNLTIEEVAKATKIKADFLYAIEKGEYDKLPSPAYASGFVKNYAKFLGMDEKKSLAIFRREFDVKKNYEVLPKGFADVKSYSFYKYKIGRSIFLAGFAIVFILGFILFQYRSAVINPKLEIDSPLENQTITSLSIEVVGKTSPESTLLINDQDVIVGKDGSFSKEITLFPGSSTIIVKSENRFGRVSLIERKILVEPNY